MVKAVQEYIKGKVGTALVLGSYSTEKKDEHGHVVPVSGNDCYDGLNQYLQKTERKISKLQARDIMSLTNTLKEVTFAVQSTKFINECESFSELMSKKDRDDLFKMTQNAEFVALSKLVKSDPSILDVNWADVKGWLFDSNKYSDEKMLKAFIRTQIYRPLFFKYNDYRNFTSNSRAYVCTTNKYFIDHNGKEWEMCASDEELPRSRIQTDLEGESSGKYTIPLESINYFNVSNKFEYLINYNPLKIVDNKFVINDVEYYVVRPDSESDAINSIYFNEFQSNTEGQNQVAEIFIDPDDGKRKFKLNGLEYVIEGNEISIDDSTEVFDENATDAEVSNKDKGRYKEWKCDIVDDRFQFDGTWYVLVRDETTNEYAFVGYADNKDNKLREISVVEKTAKIGDEEVKYGYSEYKPWNISFQFSLDWREVQVVKKHQSDVIDRLSKEWCEFDERNIKFPDTLHPEDKTYDWYLANEILRICQDYSSAG